MSAMSWFSRGALAAMLAGGAVAEDVAASPERNVAPYLDDPSLPDGH